MRETAGIAWVGVLIYLRRVRFPDREVKAVGEQLVARANARMLIATLSYSSSSNVYVVSKGGRAV